MDFCWDGRNLAKFMLPNRPSQIPNGLLQHREIHIAGQGAGGCGDGDRASGRARGKSGFYESTPNYLEGGRRCAVEADSNRAG